MDRTLLPLDSDSDQESGHVLQPSTNQPVSKASGQNDMRAVMAKLDMIILELKSLENRQTEIARKLEILQKSLPSSVTLQAPTTFKQSIKPVPKE